MFKSPLYESHNDATLLKSNYGTWAIEEMDNKKGFLFAVVDVSKKQIGMYEYRGKMSKDSFTRKLESLASEFKGLPDEFDAAVEKYVEGLCKTKDCSFVGYMAPNEIETGSGQTQATENNLTERTEQLLKALRAAPLVSGTHTLRSTVIDFTEEGGYFTEAAKALAENGTCIVFNGQDATYIQLVEDKDQAQAPGSGSGEGTDPDSGSDVVTTPTTEHAQAAAMLEEIETGIGTGKGNAQGDTGSGTGSGRVCYAHIVSMRGRSEGGLMERYDKRKLREERIAFNSRMRQIAYGGEKVTVNTMSTDEARAPRPTAEEHEVAKDLMRSDSSLSMADAIVKAREVLRKKKESVEDESIRGKDVSNRFRPKAKTLAELSGDPLKANVKDVNTYTTPEGGHNFELKDVQTYYDMQVLQGLETADALERVHEKFKLKGRVTVSPVGIVAVDGLLSDKDKASQAAAQAATDKALATAKADADKQNNKDHELEKERIRAQQPKVVVNGRSNDTDDTDDEEDDDTDESQSATEGSKADKDSYYAMLIDTGLGKFNFIVKAESAAAARDDAYNVLDMPPFKGTAARVKTQPGEVKKCKAPSNEFTPCKGASTGGETWAWYQRVKSPTTESSVYVALPKDKLAPGATAKALDESVRLVKMSVSDAPREFTLDELRICYKQKSESYQIGFEEWCNTHYRKANESVTPPCPGCGSSDPVTKTDDGGFLCNECDQRFNVDEVYKPLGESIQLPALVESSLAVEKSCSWKGEPLEKRYATFLKTGNTFKPSSPVIVAEKLEPCAYEITLTPWGVEFTKVRPQTDELLKFPSSVMEEILREVDRFWERKKHYEDLGLMHTRGILAYGPPGSGKSSMLQQVTEYMYDRGDVVFFATGVSAIKEGLRAFRDVEPERRCVVCFEEAEALARYNERELLGLLDGDAKINNVIYLATTNYIDQISPRMLRPGRFDKKVFVGHPPYEGRLAYLEHKLKGKKLAEDASIKKLAKATEGLSFGALRELLVGAFALGEPVDEVLARLREKIDSMKQKLYAESVAHGGTGGALNEMTVSASVGGFKAAGGAVCAKCGATGESGKPCPGCDTVLESVSIEVAKKSLVPGKSIVIDNIWWTIKSRDIDKNTVTLRVSDWAIKDGHKAGTKETTFDGMVANINKGTWGCRIDGKAHGKQQDKAVRAKQREKAGLRKAGLRKAPGTSEGEALDLSKVMSDPIKVWLAYHDVLLGRKEMDELEEPLRTRVQNMADNDVRIMAPYKVMNEAGSKQACLIRKKGKVELRNKGYTGTLLHSVEVKDKDYDAAKTELIAHAKANGYSYVLDMDTNKIFNADGKQVQHTMG